MDSTDRPISREMQLFLRELNIPMDESEDPTTKFKRWVDLMENVPLSEPGLSGKVEDLIVAMNDKEELKLSIDGARVYRVSGDLHSQSMQKTIESYNPGPQVANPNDKTDVQKLVRHLDFYYTLPTETTKNRARQQYDLAQSSYADCVSILKSRGLEEGHQSLYHQAVQHSISNTNEYLSFCKTVVVILEDAINSSIKIWQDSEETISRTDQNKLDRYMRDLLDLAFHMCIEVKDIQREINLHVGPILDKDITYTGLKKDLIAAHSRMIGYQKTWTTLDDSVR